MRDSGDMELGISKIEMVRSRARMLEPAALTRQFQSNRAQLNDRVFGTVVALGLVAAGALLLGGYHHLGVLVFLGSFIGPMFVFAWRRERLRRIREKQLRQTSNLPSVAAGFERN